MPTRAVQRVHTSNVPRLSWLSVGGSAFGGGSVVSMTTSSGSVRSSTGPVV